MNLRVVLMSAMMVFSLSSYGGTDSLRVLTPKSIKKLLGPYPASGSEAEARDFEILRHFQQTRSEEDCALAEKQEKATLQNLFVSNNGPLTKKEALLVTPRILKAYAEAGINIYLAKSIFKRPRPYIYNNEIKPCIKLEKSYAYPSGHTAVGRVFARALSKIYPERAEAFMERANEVAMNRILGGVHHPSDIVAGKKLGDALARKVLMRLE